MGDSQIASAAVDADAGPLDGVVVVEVADELGEYCGRVLASMGADVIKVEPPGGETTRRYGPFYHDDPHPNRSLHFWHYNLGKRGVVLDVDLPDGQEGLRSLIRTADVVIDSRPRGYLADRGLSVDGLRSDNPGLVYTRISHFGDTGPWKDFEACDLVHLALGGVMMNCGYHADLDGTYRTPPIAPQMWQAYHLVGEMTAAQIVAALCYRNVTGRGQVLDASVHDAVSMTTEADLSHWVFQRRHHLRRTCGHSYAQTLPDMRASAKEAAGETDISITKDGRWILPYTTYLQFSYPPGTGDALSRTIELLAEADVAGDLIDEKYTDRAYTGQARVQQHISDVVDRYVAREPFASDLWMGAQVKGLTWAPLRRPEENLLDDHWTLRQTFPEVEYPELGASFRDVWGRGVVDGVAPSRAPRRAPLLGEHSEDVLSRSERPAERAHRTRDVRRAGETTAVSAQGKPFGLAGLRIIDLSWALASAGAGRYFAAHGAEVIKIEHESRIDGMRHGKGTAPVGGRAARDAATAPLEPIPGRNLNTCGAFMEINSGKLSVSLNLRDERGKEILRGMIRDADMVIEGFSPGTFSRMGFSYEELRRINPKIIYVQQSGFGELGTYGRLRSLGPTAQAFSGLSEMSGLPEPFPPAGIGYSYLDWFGAYHMASAMMTALYRRDMTGSGCWIDSSQLEAGMCLTGTTLLDYTVNGRRWRRAGNRSPYNPAAPHGAYRTAGDDRWIALGAFTEAQWQAVARVLGQSSWTSDPRFVTLAERMKHQDVLDSLVNAETERLEPFALMDELQDAGVPAGVCQTAQDRCERDPQLRHREWLTELQQSEIGLWPVKGSPVKFSETAPYHGGLKDRNGPNYGEDTDEVLQRLLHLNPDEVAKLRLDGVI